MPTLESAEDMASHLKRFRLSQIPVWVSYQYCFMGTTHAQQSGLTPSQFKDMFNPKVIPPNIRELKLEVLSANQKTLYEVILRHPDREAALELFRLVTKCFQLLSLAS